MPDYVDRMAFQGETPWHGLGEQMEKGESIEAWIEKAGLGWSILSAPVLYNANGVTRGMEDTHVLYRSDTGAALSTVTGKYKVVQPREVLEFFRDLTVANGLEMETAGSLKGGAIYWALARIGDSFEVGKGDRHEAYTLLYSSADKSHATTGRLTDVRVVCYNTFRASNAEAAAKGKDARQMKVKHSRMFDEAAKSEVITALGLANYSAKWAKVQADMLAIAEKQIAHEQAEAYFRILLRPNEVTDGDAIIGSAQASKLFVRESHKEEEEKRSPRGLEMLLNAYSKAPGAVEGNLYGAFNAVTYYVDHMRGTDSANRMYSAQFSQGATMKDRAMALALAV